MKLSLKACRVNVNVTAKEMASAIGVCEDTIYNWESGKYAPSMIQVDKIIKFFADNGFPISIDNIKFLHN